ncbi:MAG: UxaA family hydrolase [Alphaproteobacteria bacterium]|jgi:hypothetical protein|nr:D-galactarate dehydratase [Rhodospirillaceae bacterium]MDP6405045.1 UxaA family hydrolase [Alphaproteobacteria bacterium]MDP6623940.1 UxaA family hydrolase [Alphaproteobacteria bacterium]|tara:strand:- start:551 stop:841 length:291 start_codon:yes stop_codon:yes gene_type:complete
MTRAIVLHPNDNVATLLADGESGQDCRLEGEADGTLRLGDTVAFGHKVALADIAAGDKVIKYGAPIGGATQAIAAGQHVHVHNVTSHYGIAEPEQR